MQGKRSLPTGIRERHSRACAKTAGKCICTPSYEASVYDARKSRELGKDANGKQRVVLVRKTFTGPGALAAAKNWRRDAAPQVAQGKITATPRQRLDAAVKDWLAKCEAGEVLSKRRAPYAPGTIRDYRADLDKHVLPTLGHRAYQDVTADEVQTIVETMNGEGLAGQTVRNAIVALQAFYRHHRRRVPVDPTDGIDLPEPGAKRERAATVGEATKLLAALDDVEHDIYAAAFYAGLRRGELQALRVDDVRDLDGDTAHIVVSRSWDQFAGAKEPKSKAGVRQIPVPATLRAILADRCDGKQSGALVFGRTDADPFVPNTVRRHAAAAWEKANAERAEAKRDPLVPIELHACRHSYSTWLDAAGISESRADRYMGHANSSVQARYRHLLPGQLAEDAHRLEAYSAGSSAGKVVTLAAAAN